MSNIIIQNTKRTIKFNKFPSYEEIEIIKDTQPHLKEVIFKNAIIPDFSILEIFKNYNLTFINSSILEYNYPITLNSSKIYFKNTKVDFRKLFFMTNMPNLGDIALLYDSIEGVNLYKPYLGLLRFFPLLKRIRLLMSCDMTYYDINHTKEFEKPFITNINVLYYTNIWENLEFLNYLPYYEFNVNDGLHFINEELYKMWNINRLLWINPKYKIYYNTFKYHELKKVKETLTLLKKYGPEFREELGRRIKDYDFNINPLNTWINLNNVISDMLKTARLNSKTRQENQEPEISNLYGLFGELLYDTKGDYIIVNNRGSIISHYSKDKNTKTLQNELLPF